MVNCDFSFLTRKKIVNEQTLANSQLQRVMSVFDVTAIGISSTLGSGIYVLAGSVITIYTGPSIVLSFIIAGIATFFSGLCYAELGARVPRSGSAYVYIYVTIGEFLGFIMGWDLILEYIIGTASIANALSQYIDLLTGSKIKSFLLATVPFNTPGLGPYPDFLAMGLVAFITVLMIIGVKESTLMNKIFTFVNILILSFIIVTGATKVDFNNWNIKTENLTWIDVEGENQTCSTSIRCGNGGFFSFGLKGVINGAAKCFYAFIGFDVIASAGEETKNPKKNIPLSIFLTLIIVGVLYCGLSSVLTLMVPYYLLDAETPLSHAFQFTNLNWAGNIVTYGAVLSLLTCLYASMFPMPRIVYAMATDGVIFKGLGKVLPKLKTPYIASIVTGFFAAIMASIFDLNELVDMLSIGTLMAYTLVSACVLLLRYRPDNFNETYLNINNKQLFNDCLKILFKPSDEADLKSFRIVTILTSISIIAIIGFSLALHFLPSFVWYSNLIVVVLGLIIIACGVLIWLQPQITTITTFKAPFVPFFPFLSILVNTYMMMTLTLVTWLRFILWFCFGIIVYSMYGIKNSVENGPDEKRMTCLPCIISSKSIKPKETIQISTITKENTVTNEPEIRF